MSSPLASVFSEKLEEKSSAECSIETLTPISFTHPAPHIVTHQEGVKGISILGSGPFSSHSTPEMVHRPFCGAGI